MVLRTHATRRFCRTFRLAWIALAGCAPIANSEDKGAGDASVIIVERGRDDAGNIVQALVHVAGMKGAGLTLAIGEDQQVPVPSDGVWHVPLSVPMRNVAVHVLEQPMGPNQECEVQQLDDDVFSVLCHDETWDVAGTIVGLEGKGLRLELFDEGDNDDTEAGGPHTVFTAAESGPFQFARPLQDNVSYQVMIAQQPTEPRQDCTVLHGEGLANANVGDIEVRCVTRTYSFTTVVSGLKGTGLTVSTNSGVFPIKPGITNYTDQFPDGFRYEIQVETQPTNPSQTCFLQNNVGQIDGANVNVMVVCDTPGNLRISEVGACPFSSSACWFEILNVGSQLENLAFYTLRTSALSPSAFTPSRIFTLPELSLPQYGHVIVQGKAPGAMPDGDVVFHVSDGDIVPWWGSDGFLELLNPAGATASFLRWGTNTMEPTTGGVYGGGAAPALPRGAGGYGYSLQHPNRPGKMPPTGDEFELHAFATYGGPNDIAVDTDDDHDGIPDVAEVPGGSFAGMSMYALGARTGQKDIFVEIDRMAGADPVTLPRKEALDKVVETFKRRNIYVHFDVGNLYSPVVNPASYNLGGGNEVPFATAVGLAPGEPGIADLYAIKAANMAANRRMVFYYQLFAWSQQKDGSGGSSGVGEMPGNDSIVTLGGFGLTANSAAQRNVITSYQAASMMHELGHNFGLRHGGSDGINRKPNYVSVMNYLYSPLGLPTIGSAEGDRYDFYKRCSVTSISQLTNAPSGDLSKFVLDFSDGGGATLDESRILESAGLGREGSKPVDYNCNGKADTASYSRDLNADGALDMLSDHDDWSALDFVFRRYATGAESGPSLRPELERFDTLTADTAHGLDEVCPAPHVPSMIELE